MQKETSLFSATGDSSVDAGVTCDYFSMQDATGSCLLSQSLSRILWNKVREEECFFLCALELNNTLSGYRPIHSDPPWVILHLTACRISCESLLVPVCTSTFSLCKKLNVCRFVRHIETGVYHFINCRFYQFSACQEAHHELECFRAPRLRFVSSLSLLNCRIACSIEGWSYAALVSEEYPF